MGVLSNGPKLEVTNAIGFEATLKCGELNRCYGHHGSDLEGEADEAELVLGVSSASSIDSEEFLEDSSDTVEAVQVLLQGLGEDIHRVGLIKTPVRVARAFAFATKGYRQAAKDLVGDALFPEAGVQVGSGFAGGLGGMVVVRSIDQYSLCESCLLPFKACCHIAYISSGCQVVGLSKLARVTDMYARRLQNPQDLANQICQGLYDTIEPLGVAVTLQSWHLPVPGCHHDLQSAQIFQHPTFAFAGKGHFEDKSNGAWGYFLAQLRLGGVTIPRLVAAECESSAKRGWCACAKLLLDVKDENFLTSGVPHSNDYIMHSTGRLKHSNGTKGRLVDTPQLQSLSSMGPGDNFSAMVNAVEVMMEVLVGGYVKEDFHATAIRYTRWLLHFKRKNQEFRGNDSTNGMLKGINGHGSSRLLSNSKISVNPVGLGHVSGVLTQVDAPFCSLCEHHLLPFFGKAHIGYLSFEASSIGVDRNMVLEIVEYLAHKLQVQERLTREIAEALANRFNLSSIIVVLEASHVCMVSRGVEKLGSSTATDAVLGRFATDYAAKAAFLERILENKEIERPSH